MTSMETHIKGFWRGLRATLMFQPKYAEDSKYIRDSTKEHLLQLSNQIESAEEIYMTLLKDGYIPRKQTQWVKKATYLKSEVSKALEEQQNSPYELKTMCDNIFENMKDCPIEDVNDKPMAFIAPMHETEDKNLADSNLLPIEDDLQAQDVEKEEPSSDRESKDTYTNGSESETISLSDFCGAYILILGSSDNMGGGTVKGESSKRILELSKSLYISQVQGEKKYKSKIIEEGDAPKGTGAKTRHEKNQVGVSAPRDVLQHKSKGESSKRILELSKSLYISKVQGEKKYKSKIIEEGDAPKGTGAKTRHEKNQVGVSDPRDVLQHKSRVPICEKNPPELQVRMSKSYSQGECWVIIPISVMGEMSIYEDLTVEILSTSSSQVTQDLNSYFGLSPTMDKYIFTTMKKPMELESDHEYLILKEMSTASEWHQAGVVNLIKKNVVLQNEEPDCPNLVLLFLQRNRRLIEIPPSFFNQMPALRFLDLSDTRIKALPSSLFKLTNLQVLFLRSCVCLDSLPSDIKHLINLEVLDLLGTDLSDLPHEIGKLTRLRHLQLSLYRPDNAHFKSELVSSKAIVKLQALQALRIEVHPKDQHWIRLVGDIIKHVGKLKKLSHLQFYFPTVKTLESFTESFSWKERRLRIFKFMVGDNIKRIISRVPDEVETRFEQHDQCLRFVNGEEVPEVMKSILKPVTAFYLDHHLEIQSLSEFNISNFKELKFCVLRECPNIQVMTIGEERTESAFPNLEYLGLHYLWKLERIWEDPIPPGSFQALNYLMISTCGKLEYIASHSILQCLSNLETFIIEDCESLKAIVKDNEMAKNDACLLPRLSELVLRHLPKLEALGSGLFPPEEIIRINFCPKLILKPGNSNTEWKKLLDYTYMCCDSAKT